MQETRFRASAPHSVVPLACAGCSNASLKLLRANALYARSLLPSSAAPGLELTGEPAVENWFLNDDIPRFLRRGAADFYPRRGHLFRMSSCFLLPDKVNLQVQRLALEISSNGRLTSGAAVATAIPAVLHFPSREGQQATCRSSEVGFFLTNADLLESFWKKKIK